MHGDEGSGDEASEVSTNASHTRPWALVREESRGLDCVQWTLRSTIELSSGGRRFFCIVKDVKAVDAAGVKAAVVESWLVFAGGAGPVRAGNCGTGRTARRRRRATHNNSSTDCVLGASSPAALRRSTGRKLRVDTCSDGRGQYRETRSVVLGRVFCAVVASAAFDDAGSVSPARGGHPLL